MCSVAPQHQGHPKETHGDTIAQPVEHTELPAAAARGVFFPTKRRSKKKRGTPFNGVFHHEAEKKHKAGLFLWGGFGTLGSSFFSVPQLGSWTFCGKTYKCFRKI